MRGIDLVTLARGDDQPSLVARAYDRVLANAFTADEIPDREPFLESVALCTVVVALRDGDPVAVAVSDHDVMAPIGLLSYLAVDAAERSSGVGSHLMSHLRELWRNGSVEFVLGEVHDPRCWEESDSERPAARLRFYERHGAQLLSVPWIQPRLRAGGNRVGGMCLLVLHSREPSPAMPAQALDDWMRVYFAAAEGVTDPAADQDLDALLRRVDAHDPVRVLPISALEQVQPLSSSG